jgi:hypothetical protein
VQLKALMEGGQGVQGEGAGAGGGAGGGGGGVGAKKAEELLVNRLCILEKALRGAAEVLGDKPSAGNNIYTYAY